MRPEQTQLLDTLRDRLGPHAVLDAEAVAERAQGIWRPAPLVARALVRPRNTEEVAFVLKACHEMGQPVIPQGGLTGLVHGADTGPDDLILSLERMNQIEEIDREARTARVQAGVLLQGLQEAVAEEGLSFPLDLGARGSCFLGGNLATNAGGNRVLRYGMARENTLGIEAVLADGTVIDSLYGMVKNNAGFDLKHLFIGSEGTLGVITRAVLRLREAPRSRLSMLLAVPDFPSVTALLRHLDRGLGGQLSAFEVMWPEFYEAVATAPRCPAPPLPLGAPFYVLAELLGADAARDEAWAESVLGDALEAGLVSDAVLASTAARNEALWALRDSVDVLAAGKPTQVFDVSLPIGAMGAYVETVKTAVAKVDSSVKVFTFGHLGDGNLHFVLTPRPREAEGVHALEAAVYDPLTALRGSVSAEHGIGLEKKSWLGHSRSPAEVQLMQTLREALDPRGILNPGKVC
jgi:FAD/FMN-containing dehydrogenase